MPLRFVLDEQLRGQPLWYALQRHNAVGINVIDVVRVGDPSDLPLGSLDPDILIWAQRHDRILISVDYSTLPTHLADHLAGGNHSPGVLMIRRHSTLPRTITALELAAHAGDPADYQDTIIHIP